MSRKNPDSRSEATRWLLPLLILAASVLVTLGIVVFEPAEAADCSGALSTDYACHQERYRELVRVSGVETAFDGLKDEYGKDGFVGSCARWARMTRRYLTASMERSGSSSITTVPTHGQGRSAERWARI